MTLRQLEAFYWIARLGSFHAAARHLHVAQPSVSARVPELERHLGVPLFERSGRGLRPTAKGRDLLPYAARMIELADEIGQRFGVTSVPAVTWMPAAMKRLAQAYPGIEAEFVVDASESLRAQLLRGERDLAFLAGPLSASALWGSPIVRMGTEPGLLPGAGTNPGSVPGSLGRDRRIRPACAATRRLTPPRASVR
jgi:DNA-binding transcriptional LysR family regulator